MSPPSGASTDPSLLRRARANEPGAWERLLQWAGPLVLYYCRRAALAEADREEVFQEVCLAVVRGLGDFRRTPTGGSFRGWVLTIALNKIRDHFRRRQRGPAEVNLDLAALPAPEPVRCLQEDDGADDAQRLLARRALELIRGEFAETSWHAFWRTAVDGLNATQAAAELGLTPQAVRQARSRVLRRLREEFGELL
jgi:RNA polymerase sigma-70 factor (ECF subfamily)